MFTMPFRVLRHIKESAQKDPLDGLVLILATQDGEQLLAVYLDDKLPRRNPSVWEARPISDMQNKEVRDSILLTFDGLCVGYEVLNLAFPSLPICGPYFYPMARLLKEMGKANIHDRIELARWVLSQDIPPHKRKVEEIVSLLLPVWLHNNPPKRGTIGLSVSSANLHSYLKEHVSPDWLTVADLNRLDGEPWILGFREVQMLVPQQIEITDWRSFLHKEGFKVLYRQGLSTLARTFWEQGQKQNRPLFRETAWELAVEYWLPQWLANDVLAVHPMGDFGSFLSKGDMLVLGRAPTLFKDTPFRIDWNDFQNERLPQQNVGEKWFALQPLNQRMEMKGIEKVAALEPIWIRSGRLISLAQALLGLAEDLRAGKIGHHWPLPRRELVWLTLRGLFLLKYSDPWARSWDGRYGIALQEAYRLLGDVLLLAEQQSIEAEQPNFALLRRWYGMGSQPEGDFEKQWHEVCRLSSILTFKPNNPDFILIKEVIELLDQPDKKPNWLSNEPAASNMLTEILQSPPPLITRQFLSAVKEWWHIHQAIQHVEREFERPKMEDIEAWLRELGLLKRRFCVLPHERTILQHFVDKDIKSLERLHAALRGQVVLQVHLLSDPLLLNKWTSLIVEIQNIGERNARDLKVELECSNPGVLEVNGALSQHITVLPARSEEKFRFAWSVRIKDFTTFWLTCEYQESGKKHKEQFPLIVHLIQQPGEGQAPQGGNLFQAGVAVSGERFYGRQEELRKIFGFLLGDTNQPILLRGPRRIGKTSLLHQIAYLLNQEGALQRQLGFRPEEEAKIRRYRPIQVSLQEVQKESDLASWFFELYQRMAQVAGESVKKPFYIEFFERNPFQGFKYSLRYHLLQVPEVYWLILLDEWDEERHVRALGRKLRAIIQNREFNRLYWIFASTWMLSAEAGRFDSPFYNQCFTIELSQMRWDEARDMVIQISRKMNVEWEGAALVKVLDQTALRPYLIQRVGQNIIAHLMNSKPPSNLVTLEVVDSVLDALIKQRDPTSPFAFLWPQSISSQGEKEARLSWLGRMILLTLYEAKRPLSTIDIQKALKTHLEQRNWEFPGQRFEEAVEENLIQLERIFDVLKAVDLKYDFSIPLARAWFYQRVQRLADPWEMAWKGLKTEYISNS